MEEEEEEGEKVEEEVKRRSKSTILAQELANTWCGGAGGAKGAKFSFDIILLR